MAAGLGFKTFTTGEVLTAADVNGYLMQGILVFANAAARTSAITSPQEGQYSFLKDTNALEYYDGAAWVGAPVGDITAVTAGTGISGGGSSGAVTITNDMATTITASGDIVVGTGSGTYDNLPIGTTGQVLTADTTVSPYKVKWAAPSALSWTTWTPTYSNLTIGNGTVVARYAYSGGLVILQWQLAWGSTSSFTGAPSIGNLPYNTKNRGAAIGHLQAANVNRPWFASWEAAASSIFLYGITTDSTYAGQAAFSNTVPGSWSSGPSDYLGIYAVYEAN